MRSSKISSRADISRLFIKKAMCMWFLKSHRLTDFIFETNIYRGKTLNAFENKHRSYLDMRITTKITYFHILRFQEAIYQDRTFKCGAVGA